MMNTKEYEFEATINKVADKNASYIIFPYDVREEFGKGRVKVHALFDDVAYNGSIVNMGLTNEDGSICYILGMTKAIREAVGKTFNDTVKMTITERE